MDKITIETKILKYDEYDWRYVVLRNLKTMTSDEFRNSLIAAGIYTEDGKLHSNYTNEKQ